MLCLGLSLGHLLTNYICEFFGAFRGSLSLTPDKKKQTDNWKLDVAHQSNFKYKPSVANILTERKIQVIAKNGK